MKTITRKLVIVAFCCSLLVVIAYAAQFDFGVLATGTAHQDSVSFGRGKNFTQLRTEIQIPQAYGRLVSVTSYGKETVLWFEADNGTIRNVNLEGAAPVILKREGSLR